MWSRNLLSCFVVMATLGVPVAAVAQRKATTPMSQDTRLEAARLEAECKKLRADLDRAQAEIATLKRTARGVRDDYRLGPKMADAEALARTLTAAEARLRQLRGTTPAAPPILHPVTSVPSDGPVELEAKADLLADQSRRLAAEAETLVNTATQVRRRSLLRNRADQLNRDPFTVLDFSKRTMVFGTASRSQETSNPEPKVMPMPAGSADSFSGEVARAGSSAPMAGAAPSGTAPAPPLPTTPPAAPTPPSATTVTAPLGPAAPTFAPQLRTLLDPRTLGQLQLLDKGPNPMSDPAALEKAAAALQERARALEAQSKDLRRQAKPTTQP